MRRSYFVLAAVFVQPSALIYKAEAGAPKRTSLLHWTYDDRLNVGSATVPGVVVQGDKLNVQVDTSQRFAGSRIVNNGDPFFGETSDGMIDFPVGMKEFYFAATGNGFVLDDGACEKGKPTTAKSAAATVCTPEPEKRNDTANWPRTPPVGINPPLTVWRCSAEKSFLPAAAANRPVRLIKPVVSPPPPPPSPPAGSGAPPAAIPSPPPRREYECAGSWTLHADDENAIDSVSVTLSIGTTRTSLAAMLTDGVWVVDAELKEPGTASASLTIKYHNGFMNTTKLATFEVEAKDEHSRVRVQPELMSSRNMRSVNLGVAITPVSDRFFKSGPWEDGWFLNGVSPSAVIRFSGDNTTVLQFGFAVSVFLNRSMLFNTGVLFGSSDPSQYWSATPNFFVGFAIDPALLTEARGTGR